MKIGIGLHVKNSAEAVELYIKAFSLELGYHVKNADGSYFHSELYKNDEEMLNVIESDENAVTNNLVQLGFQFADEAELRRAFDILREGGKVKTEVGPLPWSPCSAEVIDKFGCWWYLTVPQHHPEDDFDPAAPWDASMYKNPNQK